MTIGAKNHPHDKAKNRPQDAVKNRPDIINPVCLAGVVDETSLKALLETKGQTAWCLSRSAPRFTVADRLRMSPRQK
jgi:hypothetical protein